MTKKSLKKLRKEITDKYTGSSFSGYEHLDDGTGDYARNVPEDSEAVSYTHLTLPTNREV